MRHNKSKLIFIFLILISLYLSTVNIISADPIVEEIKTIPEKPKPLTTFKVIATITGENITSVKVTISECNEKLNQCYIAHANLPMTLNNDGYYETILTLEDNKDRSDHVQYQFFVNDNGTDYTLTDKNWKTFLNLSSSDGTSNGNGDNNNSPGFELILIIIALIVGLALYKKKR